MGKRWLLWKSNPEITVLIHLWTNSESISLQSLAAPTSYTQRMSWSKTESFTFRFTWPSFFNDEYQCLHTIVLFAAFWDRCIRIYHLFRSLCFCLQLFTFFILALKSYFPGVNQFSVLFWASAAIVVEWYLSCACGKCSWLIRQRYFNRVWSNDRVILFLDTSNWWKLRQLLSCLYCEPCIVEAAYPVVWWFP